MAYQGGVQVHVKTVAVMPATVSFTTDSEGEKVTAFSFRNRGSFCPC